jgi:coproporphyrinogen III oxidase-like Fe-S oxidoreductase
MSGAWRGFGCGAHSTVGGWRWQNVPGTADYVERVANGDAVAIHRREIAAKARMEESLFTGLRLVAGIDRVAFAATFGLDPWLEYGDRLTDAAEAGLVWTRAGHFGLTRPGMLVANEILSIFV